MRNATKAFAVALVGLVALWSADYANGQPVFGSFNKNAERRFLIPLFELLTSTGPFANFGVGTVKDLCDTASANGLLTGNYFCLRGDGTQLASTGMSLSAVGSPTTQSDRVCPNGPDCAAVDSQRFNGSTQYYETGAVSTPSGDMSICVVVRTDKTTHQQLVSKDSDVAGGRSFEFAVGPDVGTYSFYIRKADTLGTQLVTAAGTVVAGLPRVVCVTYDFVADGTSVARLYVDKVLGASSTTAAGPLQANTVPYNIARRVYSTAQNHLAGNVFGAFVVERVLTADEIIALTDAVRAGLTGTKGETVTTTRSTMRTCTASDGSITKIAANRSCVTSTSRSVTNLLLHSEDLTTDNGYFTKDNVSITADATAAPDGNTTAEAMSVAASAAGSYFERSGAVSTTDTYTVSVDIKASAAAVGRTVGLGNYNNGTMQTSGALTLTGDWKRYSFTFTPGGTTNNNVFIRLKDFGGDLLPGEVIYVSGFQIEKNNSFTLYCKTTSVSTPCTEENGPLLDIRPTVQNVALRSEEFDNAAWSNYGTVSIAPNVAKAPDGTLTADRITANNNNGKAVSVGSLVAGTYQYTLSVYGLKDGANASSFMIGLVGSADHIPFKTCTPSSTTTWERCTTTGTFTLAATETVYLHIRNAAATGVPFLAWGAQSVAASVPGAYCPTEGTSSTCNGDLPKTGSIATGPTPSFAFTFSTAADNNAVHYLLQPYTSTTNRWNIYLSGMKFRCEYYDGVAAVGHTYSVVLVKNTTYRARCSYNGATMVACIDGTCESTNGTITPPASMSEMRIGWGDSNDLFINGTISNICIDPNPEKCR